MKRNRLKYIIFGLLLIIGFAGCKYSKPLTAVRISKYTDTDSTTNRTTDSEHYKYLSLRKFAITGGYYKRIIYDESGTKIREVYSKKTPYKMLDGHVRYYTKIMYFDSDGNLTHIDYKIFQHKGRGGEFIEKKTVHYKNGKKTKTVNKLE